MTAHKRDDSEALIRLSHQIVIWFSKLLATWGFAGRFELAFIVFQATITLDVIAYTITAGHFVFK